MTCDVSTITDREELEAIIRAAYARDLELQQQAADSDQQRRQRIAQAVDSLTALLGPDHPSAAGQGSIREMRLYSDADLQQHAGLAIRLVLEGMEILTATARDVARVVGEEV